jgi:dephospho-CoA kinase
MHPPTPARRPRLVVGLTGGIGSGKSTAARFFRALGVPVIDADELAREAVAPGEPALDRLTGTLGKDVLDPHGGLDRARLRGRLFADPALRRQVEAILHPVIRQRMVERLAGVEAAYCILAIPLLIEARQTDLVDRILVIDSPDALRRQRLAARVGWSETDIEAALRAQAGREARLQHADDVIVNDGDLAALERSVERLHRRYLTLAAAPLTDLP